MSNEPENAADALVEHIDNCIGLLPEAPGKNKLETMRMRAIDAFNLIGRLQTRIAYMERDSREAYKSVKILIASGLIDEEHYSDANRMVTEARSPQNTYTDLDTIKCRNIAADNKEQEE
jgi:hypothetical protein